RELRCRTRPARRIPWPGRGREPAMNAPDGRATANGRLPEAASGPAPDAAAFLYRGWHEPAATLLGELQTLFAPLPRPGSERSRDRAWRTADLTEACRRLDDAKYFLGGYE